MRCSYCGSNHHDLRTCPHTWGGSAARANLRCTHCGGRDHCKQACRKRHTCRAEQEKGVRILDPWRR